MSSKYTVDDIITRTTITKGSIIDHLQSDFITQLQSKGYCSDIDENDRFVVADDFPYGKGRMIRLVPLTGVEFSHTKYNFIDLEVPTPGFSYKNVKQEQMTVYDKCCSDYYEEINSGSDSFPYICVELRTEVTNNIGPGQKGILMYSPSSLWCFKCFKKAKVGLVLFSKVIHPSDTNIEKDTFVQVVDANEVLKLRKKYNENIHNVFDSVTIGSQALIVTAENSFGNAVVSNTDKENYINIFNTEAEDSSLLPFEAPAKRLLNYSLKNFIREFTSLYLLIKYNTDEVEQTWKDILSPYVPILEDYQLVHNNATDKDGMAFNIQDSFGEQHYQGWVCWQNGGNPYMERFRFLTDDESQDLVPLKDFYKKGVEECDYRIAREYLGLTPGTQIKINSSLIGRDFYTIPEGIRAIIIENLPDEYEDIDYSIMYAILKDPSSGYLQTKLTIPTTEDDGAITIVKQTNIKNKTIFTKFVDFERDEEKYSESEKLFIYPKAFDIKQQFTSDVNIWRGGGKYDSSKFKIPQLLNDGIELASTEECKAYAEEEYLDIFIMQNNLDEYIKPSLAKNESFRKASQVEVEIAADEIRFIINRHVLKRIKEGDTLEVLETPQTNRFPIKKGDIIYVKNVVREHEHSAGEFCVVDITTGEEFFLRVDLVTEQLKLRIIKTNKDQLHNDDSM